MKHATLIMLLAVIANTTYSVVTPINDLAINYAKSQEEIGYSIGLTACLFTASLYASEIQREMTTTQDNHDGHWPFAPLGQFGHADRLATAEDIYMKNPQCDTFYSIAWLDLSRKSYVITIPDMHDRYFVLGFSSAWGRNIFKISQYDVGSHAQEWLILSPQFASIATSNSSIAYGDRKLNIFVSPCNIVLVLGRILVAGDDDLPQARALQTQFKSDPFASFAAEHGIDQEIIERFTPDPAQQTRDYSFNPVTPKSLQYFERIAQYLQNNPPTSEEMSFYNFFSRIGITPHGFDLSKIDAAMAVGLSRALPAAIQILRTSKAVGWGETLNGWRTMLDQAAVEKRMGEDYISRGGITLMDPAELLNGERGIFGIGPLKPSEAVYYIAQRTTKGLPLHGRHRYKIHFAQPMPSCAFWSIIAYDAETNVLIENPIKRYALGDRSNLLHNDDGSFDIYIQKDEPSEERANWLPVADRPYYLMLRIYKPSRAVYEREWIPALIEQLG